MKLAFLVGTRPEIIKMSKLLKLYSSSNYDILLIHSNQHYDYQMDKIFFNEFNIPQPDYFLECKSGSHAEQKANIIVKLEKILIKENVTHLFVHGDTNTTISGAIVSSKLNIKIIHIEAGLRSYDRSMPEEINRVITDHLSFALFAPTKISVNNLRREGITKNVYLVGNTIVDSLSDLISPKLITKKQLIIMTIHRRKNISKLSNIQKYLEILNDICKTKSISLLFPMHPILKNKIAPNNYPNLNFVSPMGYIDFINALSESTLVITDSGGIQEEACILKIPCITIRDNTERPETIELGANKLISLDQSLSFKKTVLKLLSNQNHTHWDHPYGKDVSEKIFKHMTNLL